MPWMDHSEGSLPPVTTTTASAPTPTTYITEDTSIEPTTIPLVDSEPVSAEDEQEDDDDFGDFGEISTPPPVFASAISVQAAAEEDDEFGDFDDAQQETVQPPPAVTVAVEEPKVMYPASDPVKEDQLEKRLTQGGSKFSADLQRNALTISKDLSLFLPLVSFPSQGYQSGEYIPPLVDYDEDDAGLSNAMPDGSKVKVDMPNEFFAEEEWFECWKEVLKEAEYSSTMSTMFRWKKSQVRKQFLLALGVGPEDLPSELLGDGSSNDAKPAKPLENTAATRTQPSIFGATVVGHPSTSVSQQPTAAAASASSSSSDQKAFDVLEAKRLCGLAEDELRNKNNEELEDLIRVLALYQLKMQEQANYWLDAKEQLVMDAEMHNKMIASLVQYATQQHLPGPKGTGRSRSPPKGAKKKVPTKR